MKKIMLLIGITFFLTGCVNIENSSFDQIINYALKNNVELKNKSSNGYSYYLPMGIKLVENELSNLVFETDKYRMYMYVDLISYNHKIKETYKKNTSSYYSTNIKKDDKFGYLEINLLDNQKYLVEIMYNYAKIEVIVDKCDMKNIVSYAMSILSSITYNDTIIESMIGEDILNYNETEFNIFETANNESNLIEYDENLSENEVEDDVPDTDLIN